ncbi:MAG: hypothetical protein V4548_10785 [Bacteroidota bacterium]
MSKNSHNNNEDQEIDLGAVSKKIGDSYRNFNRSIFKAIQFCMKKKYILGSLFILGVGLGIYLDDTQKVYDHKVIVKANFGSADYLYSKVELLNSKIKERDTMYLKSIGIQNPKKIVKIEIEPIVDVYKFVENREQNFEMLKLFAEDGDLKKIVEENITSKNYPYHIISYTTKNPTSAEKTLNPLMNYFNNSPYFKSLQNEYVNNTKLKMQANEITLSQIDAILNKIGTSNEGKNDRMVFNSGDSQLDDVLKTKDEMQRQQGYFKVALIEETKIIKDVSSIINKKNTEAVNGKMKLVLPFLFCFLYIFIFLFRKNYKKFKSKIQAKTN